MSVRDGRNAFHFRWSAFLSAVLFLFLAGNALATDYYVSPTGSNGNAGTLAQPFQSIQQAANVAQAGDNVYIRGGTYRETVAVKSSGTAAAPINFLPYAGEQVTVTGLDALGSSWSQYSGPIYNTQSAASISQVFYGGKPLTEARWPNPVYNNPLRAVAATVDAGSINTTAQTATIGDSALGAVNSGAFNGAKVSIVSGNTSGGNSEYVAWLGANVAHSGNSLTYSWSNTIGSYYAPSAPNHYYVYGSVNALSGGNQWYQDSSTGKLYIQTANGAAPASQQVEVRTRADGFDFGNQSNVNVSGIRFLAANVQVSGTNNVVNNCQVLYSTPFTDPTNWKAIPGVTISGQNNTLKNSEIGYSWGDGVTLTNSHNTVNNNVIHDVDWSGTDSSFVTSSNVGNNTITNNTMYNSGRSGVEFAANLAPTPQMNVSHNDIARFGYLTKDLGGIRFSYQGADSDGSVVSHNIIHDDTTSGISAGIYPDGTPTVGSYGFTVDHNLVYNVQRGVQVNRTAINDSFYNNTFWGVTYAMGSGGTGDFTNVQTYNNLSNSSSWVGTSQSNNLRITSNPFVDSARGDYRPRAGTSAVDGGRVIPGITDGYSGNAPNVGAFESGQDPWTAGANFKTWLFANQVSPPLQNALYVTYNGSRVDTGSLQVGNSSSITGRDSPRVHQVRPLRRGRQADCQRGASHLREHRAD